MLRSKILIANQHWSINILAEMNTSVISIKFNFDFLSILHVTAMGLDHFDRGSFGYSFCPFSNIFIKIASFLIFPYFFALFFYESTHASDNFKTVIHVSIFPCGHFSLWAFFPVGIFPVGIFPVTLYPTLPITCVIFSFLWVWPLCIFALHYLCFTLQY